MISIVMTPAELVELTGYRRGAEQLDALKRLGFWRARRSVSGCVVLERAHYEAVCRGSDAQPARQERPRLRAA